MRLKLSYAFSENWWVELEREREKLREKGGGGGGERGSILTSTGR